MGRLCGALIVALAASACIVLPQRPTRQPVDRWLEGFSLESTRLVTYCIRGSSPCEKPLPEEHWPEMVRLVRSLEQLSERAPNDWELEGRLYVTFGDARRLVIGIHRWPSEGGDRLVAWVQGGSMETGYNSFGGSALWEWLSGVTSREEAEGLSTD